MAHDRHLRDPVLLHHVDRLADFLVRRDRDQVGRLAVLVLEAEHLGHLRRGLVPLEEAELDQVVVVEELGQVGAAAVR